MPALYPPPDLDEDEFCQAVAQLSTHLRDLGVHFSISGGAAVLLTRIHYQIPTRVTYDIDLVVQPSATTSAETVGASLVRSFPATFIEKHYYGVPIPAIAAKKADGSGNMSRSRSSTFGPGRSGPNTT